MIGLFFSKSSFEIFQMYSHIIKVSFPVKKKNLMILNKQLLPTSLILPENPQFCTFCVWDFALFFINMQRAWVLESESPKLVAL